MEDAVADAPDQPALTRLDVLDTTQVATDLDGVELALARLDAGTYWTCEATGQPLPDDVLAADPTVRRLPAT
jgi:RNA polymerase-binding transcription factor DksA